MPQTAFFGIRRRLLRWLAVLPVGLPFAATEALAAETASAPLSALDAIRTRRSVRAYTEAPVSDALVEEIIACGMQAPSACNEQPWQFVVVRDKALLAKVGGINPYAAYAKNAPVAVLVAGDTTLDKCGGYWVQDCSACAENMLGWVEAWVTVIIVGREIAVTGLRAIAADMGVVIAADRFGKLKTILQMVALCPLVLHFPWYGLDPNPLGKLLLYLALVLTLVSGANYFYGFGKKVMWPQGPAGRRPADQGSDPLEKKTV